MEKARSRLATTENQAQTGSAKSPTDTRLPVFFTRYKKYVPTLGLGILNWILFYLLLTRIYPQTVQHWFIPHLYIPVLIIFFLAMLFSSAFLFLNTRRGFLLAAAATCFLFLKLQQVSFTIEVVSTILIFFGILELSFLMINYGLGDFIQSLKITKRKPRANLKQKTRHRQRN
jgi:hypothetical protein